MQDRLPLSCEECVVVAICDKHNKNGSWKHREGKVPCPLDKEKR